MIIILVIASYAPLSVHMEATVNFDWAGIRNELKDSLVNLERSNVLHGAVVGIAGRTSRQWYQQQWVKQRLNKSEAEKLLEHPKGAIKALAAECLLRNRETDVFGLLEEALNDTTSIFYHQSGCSGWPLLLGEYLMEQVTYLSERVPPPPGGRKSYGLSEEEIGKLLVHYELRLARKEEYLMALRQ